MYHPYSGLSLIIMLCPSTDAGGLKWLMATSSSCVRFRGMLSRVAGPPVNRQQVLQDPPTPPRSDQLRTHLADFMAAYNFARRLKTLSGLTPYEYIAKIWTSELERFIVNPMHQIPGLNT